jgi:hypothetical protein
MDDNREGIRRAVEAADATGLVAGEELITAAETRPALPHQHLHAALPAQHAAHATIDALQTELSASAPDPAAIAGHVTRLRALPELEAIVTNWWENPLTQRFVAGLSQIGL